jgi:hypothetical protein
MGMVVASTTSKRGGRLSCGHVARAGDMIHKVDKGDRGGTTSGGNGYGEWMCPTCAAAAIGLDL